MKENMFGSWSDNKKDGLEYQKNLRSEWPEPKKITLTDEQYDNFQTICNEEQEASQEIKDAAKKLDDEGF